ncbi:unnamed protein product [Penicillium egyptiacum]|uniref:FAD-binding FR-type domain-containing protein n=1 Tax=Penicillium egyptiacum TaxID=1303716 RepID=A0A9W4KPW1_9EURO|nr:unnamed protein product [Penicillium egyptiacum]
MPGFPNPTPTPIPGIKGWHPGETAIQTKLGFSTAVSSKWTAVEPQLREQHRIFHTSNLSFIPMTVIDKDGRPWAGIAAGRDGRVGFVRGPDLKTLVFGVRVWKGEPLGCVLRDLTSSTTNSGNGVEMEKRERALTAGLGIEFSTRRRNKFAGIIRDVVPNSDEAGGKEGLDYVLEVDVNEAVGNCPKYINTRHLDPHPRTNPQLAYQVQLMAPGERLPDDVVQMITTADTVFIGSIYKSTPATATEFPSHAGMNARGGLPGFIRVRPSDGRSVVIPDYSGNRFMSSLGNIEASGLAGFTIVSFTTGDVLYLTGRAKVLIGPPAMEIMSRHASITVLETTGYTLVRDALPVRQRPGSDVGRSPYSPKVKYLVEEAEAQSGSSNNHKAELESAVQLSDDLAVFKFKVLSKDSGSPLRIRPGQAIVLDFMDWLGPPEYQHMAGSAPGSINDDRVRTWTVSSAHENQNTTCFELTMREMKGGAVTGALFDILRRKPASAWGRPIPISDAVISDIVGVSGDFCLTDDKINVLWVAGGIGITPFLAMLDALAARGRGHSGDIQFALATREPAIMLDLMGRSLKNIPTTIRINIDIFTRCQIHLDTEEFNTESTRISIHEGRIGPGYWKTVSMDKDVLICGPDGFGNSAVENLRAVGVPNEKIHREGFY